MIVTTRNKEKNFYDVYYDHSTDYLFTSFNYNNNIEITYNKNCSLYKQDEFTIRFYFVASFRYKYLNINNHGKK